MRDIVSNKIPNKQPTINKPNIAVAIIPIDINKLVIMSGFIFIPF